MTRVTTKATKETKAKATKAPGRKATTTRRAAPAAKAGPKPVKKPSMAKADANKLKNRERALKSWATRRRNLIAAGLLLKNGEKTPALKIRRRKQALRAWNTRREREAAAVAAAKRAERKARRAAA